MARCPSCGHDLTDTEPEVARPSSSGRRRRLSRLQFVGLLGVVGVVAVAVWAMTGDDDRASPEPASKSNAGPAASSPELLLPPPLRRHSVSTGSLLVSANPDSALIVQTVDNDTVRSVAIPDVKPGESVYRLVGAGTGAVALVANSTGQGPVWSFSADALRGTAVPIRLGEGIDMLLNPGSGSVTIVSAMPSAHFFVQSMNVDGTGATAVVPVPEGFVPDAWVFGRIVLQGSTGPTGGPVLRLWNPEDQTFTADIGMGQSPILMAAAGSTVVWRNGRSNDHDVHVFDSNTGSDTVIPVGDAVVGYESDRPAASADGTRVAFGLESPTSVEFSIGVLDVSSQQLHVTPFDDSPAGFVWSPDARWLFVETTHGLSLYNEQGQELGQLASFEDTNRLQPKVVVSVE